MQIIALKINDQKETEIIIPRRFLLALSSLKKIKYKDDYVGQISPTKT
jgi:hypothetical protein